MHTDLIECHPGKVTEFQQTGRPLVSPRFVMRRDAPSTNALAERDETRLTEPGHTTPGHTKLGRTAPLAPASPTVSTQLTP